MGACFSNPVEIPESPEETAFKSYLEAKESKKQKNPSEIRTPLTQDPGNTSSIVQKNGAVESETKSGTNTRTKEGTSFADDPKNRLSENVEWTDDSTLPKPSNYGEHESSDDSSVRFYGTKRTPKKSEIEPLKQTKENQRGTPSEKRENNKNEWSDEYIRYLKKLRNVEHKYVHSHEQVDNRRQRFLRQRQQKAMEWNRKILQRQAEKKRILLEKERNKLKEMALLTETGKEKIDLPQSTIPSSPLETNNSLPLITIPSQLTLEVTRSKSEILNNTKKSTNHSSSTKNIHSNSTIKRNKSNNDGKENINQDTKKKQSTIVIV